VVTKTRVVFVMNSRMDLPFSKGQKSYCMANFVVHNENEPQKISHKLYFEIFHKLEFNLGFDETTFIGF